MNIARFDELKPYDAPHHFQMAALRVHGKETCGAETLTVGLSHFLPGGGADSRPVPEGMELVYYVVEGEMAVTTSEGRSVLRKGDSIFLRGGELRGVKNETTAPASMLVIIGKR